VLNLIEDPLSLQFVCGTGGSIVDLMGVIITRIGIVGFHMHLRRRQLCALAPAMYYICIIRENGGA
jgi:hypothetical protein